MPTSLLQVGTDLAQQHRELVLFIEAPLNDPAFQLLPFMDRQATSPPLEKSTAVSGGNLPLKLA